MSKPPPDLTRRTVLTRAAAGAALAAIGSRTVSAKDDTARTRSIPKMPVGFVSHGSPMTALNPARNAELLAWTRTQAKPVAVLVVSAHYQRSPVSIGATKRVPLIYDFRGFPKKLYDLKYAPPGAPKLAKRVEQVLAPVTKVMNDPRRGHDHGAWVPLRAMYPDADVPILSISLPSHDPKTLFKMGRALRPLRDEGVFILGSGAMTHNLRYRPQRGATKPPGWAAEFDTWVRETLDTGDVDALLDWQRKAPGAAMSHPTVEHFVPLLIAAGARKDADVAGYPIQGFDGVAFSSRSVSFATPAKPPKAG